MKLKETHKYWLNNNFFKVNIFEIYKRNKNKN